MLKQKRTEQGPTYFGYILGLEKLIMTQTEHLRSLYLQNKISTPEVIFKVLDSVLDPSTHTAHLSNLPAFSYSQ